MKFDDDGIWVDDILSLLFPSSPLFSSLFLFPELLGFWFFLILPAGEAMNSNEDRKDFDSMNSCNGRSPYSKPFVQGRESI